jgi:tryptophanyl-tRNA synthetase
MKDKIEKINLFISSEVRAKFPDLQEALMPVYGVKVEKDESILTEDDFKDLLKGKTEEQFFDQEDFKLFREFAKDLKINLKKNPPSVEFLYKQFKKTGKIPHINNIVDSANKVALETFVATGTFDMDKIEGDMNLRFTREGEEFRPLGGDIEYLPAGLVVIADENKILNLFPFRDSIYQKITEKTKNVLILADKMPGQDAVKIKDAVSGVAELLVENAGGEKGKMYFAEEKSEKGTYVVSYEDLKDVKDIQRVFSGTRATGRLHLGNYLGAVKGYLDLQNSEKFECIFMAVDVHTITTPYDHKNLPGATREIIMDYLACGLDPDKVIVTAQSMIPEHMELAFYFSSIMSVARMQHLPTFKDKIKQYPDNVTMALLNYPILMASDILIYKAGLVPVGIDQEPHLEIAREIAKKMNDTYKTSFPEPIRFATKGEYVPSLLGEGKMSKSVEGSYINLADNLEMIKLKLAKVPTDSGRGLIIVDQSYDLIRDLTAKSVKRNDTETLERLFSKKEFPLYVSKEATNPSFGVKSLLTLVDLFEGKEKKEKYENDYQNEGIRYGEMKAELAEAIYHELKPIQERRKIYEKDPSLVEKILENGAEKARKIAADTVKEVKEKMGLA